MNEHVDHDGIAGETAMSGEPPIVEARAARKTYRLGKIAVPVLKGASLEIRQGEWVAILGASGSGKSTLLHLLGGLDTDDDGGDTVRHRGKALSRMGLLERNRYRNGTVGFVFQFYHLLPELTVVDNVILPGLVRHSLVPWWRRAIWALPIGTVSGLAALWALRVLFDAPWPLAAAAAGAAAVVTVGAVIAVTLELATLAFNLLGARQRMVNRATDLLTRFGLAHRLDHRPAELSGGERQRVAIARALINEPAVLLADEPTGNLDQATGQEILALLEAEHRRGLTIVMVTHDPAIAARADRQVQIVDGVVKT